MTEQLSKSNYHSPFLSQCEPIQRPPSVSEQMCEAEGPIQMFWTVPHQPLNFLIFNNWQLCRVPSDEHNIQDFWPNQVASNDNTC